MSGVETHLIFVQTAVHDTESVIGTFPNVAAEEDWLAGFDHLHNGGFQVGDMGVDVCNTIFTKVLRASGTMEGDIQSTGRPPHTFPSLSTVYNLP